MDISIKGIDKDVVSKIDSKTKKQNMSRNVYLKKIITYDSKNYALKQKKNMKL